MSSSREAARLLFEAEDRAIAHPESPGDTAVGDAVRPPAVENVPASTLGAGRRRPWLILGVLLMLPALALLAVAVVAQLDSPPPPPPAAAEAANPAAIDAARRFLMLIDAADWRGSYAAMGAAMRRANTLKLWADTSIAARAPLGAVAARTLLSAEDVPAPQHGLTIVKFQTRFANRSAVETVSLGRENGDWRVVGVTLD